LLDYIFRRLALDYLTYEQRLDLGVLSTNERMQPTLPGVEEAVTQTTGMVDLTSTGSPTAATTPAPAPAASTSAPIVQNTISRQRPVDAPFCYSCGNEMNRAGSCYVCSACGTTSGCS
jgi:ribonucleoside-diphosphate reductase alpha chain